MRRTVRSLGFLALLPLGGCSVIGGAVGGLTSAVGSLASLLISLAAIAAPIALSYWLYTRERD